MSNLLNVHFVAFSSKDNFFALILLGCELKADKKEYAFKVDDDENDHQLSLKTVSFKKHSKLTMGSMH